MLKRIHNVWKFNTSTKPFQIKGFKYGKHFWHRALVLTQQTFILIKTSSRRLQDVFCLRLQKTSSGSLDQDEYIRLSHTSSEDVFKTSLKHFQDVLQKRLQDILKTYHQVKVFLLTHFRHVFNTFLRRTAKTVIYRRICLDHTSNKFMVNVQNLQDW